MQIEPNCGVELTNLEYFKIIPNFDDADFCREKPNVSVPCLGKGIANQC